MFDDLLIKKMNEFTIKYKNKEINFDDLTDDEKYIYVAVDTFCYFADELNYKETMKRVFSNCNSHQSSNYSYFKGKKLYLK